MPIQVTCPGCKATFSVSEKFAGKQGPCPKCKAPIQVPKVAAAANPAGAATVSKTAVAGKPAAVEPPVDVKIHGPEEAAKTGKTKTGHPTSKPLLRTDARLTWKLLLFVVGTTTLLFVAAYFGRTVVAGPAPLYDSQLNNADAVSAHRMAFIKVYALRAVALLAIGWPIVIAGYTVLRDDELEPYRGRGLHLRTLYCLIGYLASWGIYAWIPDDLRQETYLWILLVPMVVLPAAVTAYFTLDLDFFGSTMHACFFFLVTLMLGWTAGLTMPWQPPETQVAPKSPDVKMEVIYQ